MSIPQSMFGPVIFKKTSEVDGWYRKKYKMTLDRDQLKNTRYLFSILVRLRLL